VLSIYLVFSSKILEPSQRPCCTRNVAWRKPTPLPTLLKYGCFYGGAGTPLPAAEQAPALYPAQPLTCHFCVGDSRWHEEGARWRADLRASRAAGLSALQQGALGAKRGTGAVWSPWSWSGLGEKHWWCVCLLQVLASLQCMWRSYKSSVKK